MSRENWYLAHLSPCVRGRRPSAVHGRLTRKPAVNYRMPTLTVGGGFSNVDPRFSIFFFDVLWFARLGGSSMRELPGMMDLTPLSPVPPLPAPCRIRTRRRRWRRKRRAWRAKRRRKTRGYETVRAESCRLRFRSRGEMREVLWYFRGQDRFISLGLRAVYKWDLYPPPCALVEL